MACVDDSIFVGQSHLHYVPVQEIFVDLNEGLFSSDGFDD